MTYDHARAYETDTSYHAGGNLRRVTKTHLPDEREDGPTQRNQTVGLEPGSLVMPLALETDHAAAEERQQQSQHKFVLIHLCLILARALALSALTRY
jgi:hypothetical protein